jgi:putative ABC transport system permease protein
VRLKIALGASTVRLIADLMAGPTVIVGAGLFGACLLCAGAFAPVAHMSGIDRGTLEGSWQVIADSLLVQIPVAVGLTLLVALLPALALLCDHRVPRTGYTSTANRPTQILLQLTVTSQIAFCIVTCILSGMMAASLVSLMGTPLGYDPYPLTAVSIQPGPNGVTFNAGPRGQTFPSALAISILFGRIRSLPGVRSVSLASSAPFEGLDDTVALNPTDTSANLPITVNKMIVTPGYFQTLGTKIIRGQDLHPLNVNGNVSEIVLNQSLARQLWPGQDPLSRSVRITEAARAGLPSYSYNAVVVGIVEDMRMSGFMASPEPTIFMVLNGAMPITRVLVQGPVQLRELDRLLRDLIPQLMPGLTVFNARRLAYDATALLRPEEKRVGFALGAAVIMAVLACLGLYGSLSYYVRTRRRELGIRICFGASSWSVRKAVWLAAIRCAGVGGLLSLPVWPQLARFSSSDYLGRLSWSTERAVLISLGAVVLSLIVSLIPAAAAANISPAEILKEE